MEVNKVLEIYDREVLLQNSFQEALAVYLNDLITNDFNAVIQILYRIDVDEYKLKEMLSADQDQDAGKLMASLIIKRQLEKINTRETFRNSNESEW